MTTIIALLGVAILAQNPDHWRTQTWYGLSFLVIAYCYRLPRAIGIMLGVSLLSALAVFQNPISQFGENAVRFDSASAKAFVFCLSIHLFSALDLKKAFRAVALCSSVVICYKFLVGQVPNAVLDNSSMDGTLLALCYPLMDRHWKRGLIILGTLATMGSTPIATLGVAIAVPFMSVRVLAATGAVTAVLGFLLQGSTLINPAGRDGLWRLSMEWWLSRANYWIGTGLGTYEELGPMIQRKGRLWGDGGFAIWMHNDWLQILFEQGIIGLAAALFLFGSVVRRSWHRPWLLASFAAYGVAMVPQMPMRFFLTALLGAYLIREAYDPKKT